jgi:general L-amino acid transport system permease protein
MSLPEIDEAMRPYVRSAMLAAEPPPLSERGMMKWMRENLFAGWVNTALTVISLAAIIGMIWSAFPWWWHSVWNAGSLRECREIVAAEGGTSGACWAVIRARWHQYLFGFYPPAFYWRPILASGLLMVALSPVLYWNNRKSAIMTAVVGGLTVLVMLAMSSPSMVTLVTTVLMAALIVLAWNRPKLLIWVTLAYPFVALFLLWGGQIWTYLSVILAVAVGIGVGLVYGKLQDRALTLLYSVVAAVGAAFVAAALIHYLNDISADFLAKFSAADFYPGIGQDGGLVAKTLGALVSAAIWVISVVVWGLVALMRWVSWVLNLNVSMLWNFPFASTLGVGALLAAIGTFQAARSRAAGIGGFGGLLALGGYLLFVHPWLTKNLAAIMPLGLSPVSSDQFGGFLLAIVIGVTAIAASLPLGILLALGRRSDMFLVKTLSVGFIEFIRGVPLITLLFTASLLLAYFLPPQTNFDLILRVIILASLFSAAYIAEVVRGGLAALPRGQYEAADALALDYWQAQRLIIMPQALKISIPGIVSTFIGLFKDTTLVSFVGLLDPLRGVTMTVRADIAWKGIYWEPYIFVGVIFFVICFGMSRYSMYLERKLKTDHR